MNHTIKPGKGIEKLLLGISRQEALQICPEPSRIKTFEQEKAIFEKHGYDINDMLQFRIGFDEVLEYYGACPYPVFKLYILNNQLNYIIFTSYNLPPDFTEAFELEGGLKFYDSATKAKQLFGEADNIINMKSYDGKSIYFSKGLELVFDSDELRVIYIFTPFLR